MHAPSADGHEPRAAHGPSSTPANHVTSGVGRGWRAAPTKGRPVSSTAPSLVAGTTATDPTRLDDQTEGRTTYVLDTSVLLSDPGALRRFAEHDVVLPLVVISELEGKRHHPELGWFARQALRVLDDLRVKHGRLDAPVPDDEGGTLHVELNHTDPRVAAGRASASTATTRASSPSRCNLRRRGSRRHAGHQGHAAAGQGGLGRPATPTSTAPSSPVEHRLDRAWPSWTWPPTTIDALYDGGRARPRGRPRELPCHTGLVLLSAEGSALGRVDAGQAGAAGARRPRGVRPARPLRRAADRARPAARPRDRHRLARRPRRHRQVGAGPVRRPGGGAGAPRAQEGRRLPAAVRGRRPGARLPARQREREDGALGAGGLRHPRRARPPRRDRRGRSTAACSRCCR